MPWRENSVMDERIGFINEYNSGCWSMTELCERFEISRKTGYKWLERYREFGAEVCWIARVRRMSMEQQRRRIFAKRSLVCGVCVRRGGRARSSRNSPWIMLRSSGLWHRRRARS